MLRRARGSNGTRSGNGSVVDTTISDAAPHPRRERGRKPQERTPYACAQEMIEAQGARRAVLFLQRCVDDARRAHPDLVPYYEQALLHASYVYETDTAA